MRTRTRLGGGGGGGWEDNSGGRVVSLLQLTTPCIRGGKRDNSDGRVVSLLQLTTPYKRRGGVTRQLGWASCLAVTTHNSI